MKKSIHRSFILGSIIGIIFLAGEMLIRIFLSPYSLIGDLPMYIYNTNMSFFTLAGYSSIWMFVIAFIFSIILGALNNKTMKISISSIPYYLQVLFGWFIIIFLELWFGILLNDVLGLAVWSYAMFPLNFMGHIAFLPSIMWLLLTPSIFFLDDLIRYYIWDEPHPDKFITYFTDIFKRS